MNLKLKFQTGQLLVLLEQLGTGDLGEITFTEKVEITKKSKHDQTGVHRENNENELNTNNTGLSTEETDELFSLCKDIQNLVDGSNDNMNDITDTSLDKLINEIPEEVAKTAPSLNCDIIDIDYFLEDDSPCNSSSISATSEESDSDLSSFLEDELSSHAKMDDTIFELFPSLAAV